MKQSALYGTLPQGKVPGASSGWITALSFGDPEAELLAALDGSAVADSSMSGRIEVTGKDRIDLLHRLSTNSLAGLQPGGAASTIFVTDKGRVIDRVTVAGQEDSLVLITSPGAEVFLTHWIEKYTITDDISLKVVTDDTIMVSLIGPRTISTFMKRSGIPPGNGAAFSFDLDGTLMHAVQSQETPGAVHVIAESAGAARLSEVLRELPGARWIGRKAYEAFRILRGIPASPGELNDAYNPFECGLRGSISFTKGCYIGQEVIARLDSYGKIRRHLVRVSSAEQLPGPLPVPVFSSGLEAGMLTSASEIRHEGGYAGLAILRNDMAEAGDTLNAGTAGRPILVSGTL